MRRTISARKTLPAGAVAIRACEFARSLVTAVAIRSVSSYRRRYYHFAAADCTAAAHTGCEVLGVSVSCCGLSAAVPHTMVQVMLPPWIDDDGITRTSVSVLWSVSASTNGNGATGTTVAVSLLCPTAPVTARAQAAANQVVRCSLRNGANYRQDESLERYAAFADASCTAKVSSECVPLVGATLVSCCGSSGVFAAAARVPGWSSVYNGIRTVHEQPGVTWRLNDASYPQQGQGTFIDAFFACPTSNPLITRAPALAMSLVVCTRLNGLYDSQARACVFCHVRCAYDT